MLVKACLIEQIIRLWTIGVGRNSDASKRQNGDEKAPPEVRAPSLYPTDSGGRAAATCLVVKPVVSIDHGAPGPAWGGAAPAAVKEMPFPRNAGQRVRRGLYRPGRQFTGSSKEI